MTSNDNTLTQLMRVQNEKDVGVIFDEDLNFQEEISSRVSKGNSIMGTIRRTYTFLNANSFKSLFTTLVRPHLEYGAPIWGLTRVVNSDLKEFALRNV